MVKRKILIELLVLFLFCYFLLIIPYFRIHNLDMVVRIIFLDFNSFQQYSLSKFSMQYLIMFLLFFQITFHQNLAVVSENTSYSSMFLNRIGKKGMLRMVVQNNISRIFSLYLITILSFVIISLIAGVRNHATFLQYDVFLHLAIYLWKYYSFVFILLFLYQVMYIIKESSYYILYSYFLMIGLLIIDFSLGTHLISYAKTIQSELSYLMLSLVAEWIVISIIMKRFSTIKEVYHD